MHTFFSKIRLIAMLALTGLLGAVPLQVSAQSGSCTTAACTVTSQVNFSVVIPSFMRFRLGATGATQDTVTFTVPAANVGDSGSIAGTGGDVGAGVSTVQVVANMNGNVVVSVAVSNAAGIPCATAGTCGVTLINWNEITTTTAGATTPPALDNGSTGTATFTATAGIVNEVTTWTFAYDNTTTPLSGTYSGNVVYTATAP